MNIHSITYTSLIEKQDYLPDGRPIFSEDAIGVRYNRIFFAANKELANKLVEHWNRFGNYTYEIIESKEISMAELPNHVAYYETLYNFEYT